jgi:hypothetical protein
MREFHWFSKEIFLSSRVPDVPALPTFQESAGNIGPLVFELDRNQIIGAFLVDDTIALILAAYIDLMT